MKIRRIIRNSILKWRCPPRYIIERKIFPKIKKKRVLFVGVADYTKEYPAMLKENDLYTLDINPSVTKFGATKHIVGNAVKVNKYFEKNFFDIILHLGVLNYGINTPEEADESIKNCFKILKKEGLLVISSPEGPVGSGRVPINIRDLPHFRLFHPINAFGMGSTYFLNNKKSFYTTFEFLKKD
jgi:SAM-dependent methyltransferase